MFDNLFLILSIFFIKTFTLLIAAENFRKPNVIIKITKPFNNYREGFA